MVLYITITLHYITVLYKRVNSTTVVHVSHSHPHSLTHLFTYTHTTTTTTKKIEKISIFSTVTPNNLPLNKINLYLIQHLVAP